MIFLLAILIPACASSSLAFHIIYSTSKLNKQGDNTQPWHTPFPIWNQSVVPCPVLTVASWPAYRFPRRQVKWSHIPISWRIFQFVVIHTAKGFDIVNRALLNHIAILCLLYSILLIVIMLMDVRWYSGFDLYFSYDHLYFFYGELSFQVLCPLFSQIICFLLLSYRSSLYILDISLFSDVGFANIFSHFVGCFFTLLIVSFGVQDF